MSTYVIYEDMTAPTITLVVTDSAGVARNISGAGVVVKLYIGDGSGNRIVDGVTMTKDGATGQVSHVLTTAQSATPGTYTGQAEVTWSAGVLERTEPFQVDIRSKV
jgi:hypothetical protein